ncbi:putative FAD-binding domain-containing protein [Seiridium cardinale]
MAPLKVLVVGGGIAGPALAHWLSRIGANITLIERSPQLRASGQQVDLRAQGIPMMKRMGIEAAVRAASVHEVGTQLVDKNGHVRAFFAAAPSGSGKQSITSEYEIMRGDLVRILFDLTEKHQNVKYLYDTTMENFTQDDESDPNGKVHVSFHDGTKEDFDLVVGADGTNSRTRKIMLGPEAPDPRHSLGGNIAYFSIPSRPEDSNVFSMCFLPGPRVSRMIGMRKDCPELARIYMISRGQDEGLDSAHKSGDLAALKKAWGDLYQDGGWQCGRFMDGLRNAPEADDLYSTPLQEVRLPEGSWAKGRVVLVGDAAYSQTAEGYGTTWALVGAYVLAGEIAALHAKEGSTAAVIQGAKNYEKEFRPVATAMHGGPYWIESVLNPRSNLGINLMYGVAKVIAFLKLDQMAAQKGEQSKWQLPQYRELEEGQTEA